MCARVFGSIIYTDNGIAMFRLHTLIRREIWFEHFHCSQFVAHLQSSQLRPVMCVVIFGIKYCFNEMIFNFNSKLLSHNRYVTDMYVDFQMSSNAKNKHHSNIRDFIHLTMMCLCTHSWFFKQFVLLICSLLLSFSLYLYLPISATLTSSNCIN